MNQPSPINPQAEQSPAQETLPDVESLGIEEIAQEAATYAVAVLSLRQARIQYELGHDTPTKAAA